jgi:hypothetical protein
MCNANPYSTLSWINLAIEYGPWLHPVSGGSVDHLPGHNSSYKRDLLLAYGSQLDAMLEAESVLHWELLAKGHQLCLEPAARTYHLNYSLRLPQFGCDFLADDCSPARRLILVTPAPVALWHGESTDSVVRLQVLRDLRQPAKPPRVLRHVCPLLGLALASDAAGEMIGYLFGGQTMQAKRRNSIVTIALSENDRRD